MEQEHELTESEQELLSIAEKMVAEYNGNNDRNRHQRGRKSTLSENWRVVLVDSDDDTDKA